MVSRRRTQRTRRVLNWRSSSSPSAGPSESLTILKRSRVMNSTAMRQFLSWASSIASRRVWKNRLRFGRPVRLS
jgi:hypothetical protein